MGKKEFAKILLQKMSLPVNYNNMKAIVVWQAMEGGPATNPLSTTLYVKDSKNMNKDRVKVYKTVDEGMNATIATLNESRYSGILSSLAKSASAQTTIDIVCASAWGTSPTDRNVDHYPTATQGLEQEYLTKPAQHDCATKHEKKKSNMNIINLLKIAKKFEEKLDRSVVIEEHEGVEPVSYMADSNLKNIIKDAGELLSVMNDQDDLPQWADESLAIAKMNVSKILSYVRSEKTKTSENESNDLVKLASGKYDHINFKPSESVASAAARGLELRKKNKGRGGLSVQQAHKAGIGSGVARAV